MDVIKSDDEDIAEALHRNDNINNIDLYLGILTPREKDIIIKRYGLFDFDELTQKEIADQMHISRSYVSRIEKRAISKIYRECKKKNIEL